MSDLTEYKCPCCGGSVKFDVKAQNMKCPYCDAEFDVEAMEEAAKESASKPADSISWDRNDVFWSDSDRENLNTYVCNSCGGEIITDKTTGAAKCPFCGNNVTMKDKFSGELRPELIIPFKLDEKAAKESYKKYITGRRLLPKLFKEDNHIDEIKGVYVPYWLFDCEAFGNVDFMATRVRHWSDSRFNYTETRHYNVHRAGTANFSGVPADGLTKMPDDLMESIEPYNLGDAVDFKTAYLSGFFADKYDVGRDESINRVNARVKQSIEECLRSTVSGYASVIPQSSSVNVQKGRVHYALCPVYILNTTYKGDKYTFAMNGQTGKMAANLPLDKRAFRKWWLIWGAVISAAVFGVMNLFAR